eukprot:TRINITY_DN9732_c0_g1_i1.p1 TRINITY_DN9732_c0_g1~~TRINITY_DN9732_c0_g1_i1.p1  ORF type:complete len:304 (-),score=32.82 TRINITY_DN9732_c0_g1_i1:435-1295(-)
MASASGSAIAARARGSVLGCLIGDAAATPVHWMYDTSKLAAHVQTARRGPEFCDPPGNFFYTTPPGGLSCYGDQTLALAESLVACRGALNVEDYSRRLADKFGKSSPYELDAVDQDDWPALKQNPKDEDGKIIEEKRLWTMPLPGPWRHGSIKGFLKNYLIEGKRFPECGSDDKQVDGCCKVAPVVAVYAGNPDMLAIVDRAVRVTQNTDIAASYACGFARVLEKIVLGEATALQDALVQVTAELADPERNFQTPLDAEVQSNLERVVEEFAGRPSDEIAKLVGIS